jgi:hypothetical protein
MSSCIINARSSRYLPVEVASRTDDYENEHFHFNATTNSLDCKLPQLNVYRKYFVQMYSTAIDEDELTESMIDVLKTYTDSQTNETYIKTNLNLLSGNTQQIDWTYVNQLRSLIRALSQSNIRPVYYRGLYLSDKEIQYYLNRRGHVYYTNSFSSFTIDRLLIYPGNAILLLRTDRSKRNLADIWKWSTFTHEKEALLAVGAKLQITSVHEIGNRWEIEVFLQDDDSE